MFAYIFALLVNICELPTNLLRDIFTYTDQKSRNQLQLVNRKFNDIITHNDYLHDKDFDDMVRKSRPPTRQIVVILLTDSRFEENLHEMK